MKKILVLAAAIALFASPVLAGINGSLHDFADDTDATGSAITGATEICVFCHTPHNAQDEALPLWNRGLPTTEYTMYNSATFNGNYGTDVPGPESLACLSCHDGSIAVDSYSNNTGSNSLAAGDNYLDSTTANLGADLSDDHPVGVTLTNGTDELKTPTGGAILFNGKVECASCHDVHNDEVTGTVGPFLIETMVNSQLCLDCHAK